MTTGLPFLLLATMMLGGCKTSDTPPTAADPPPAQPARSAAETETVGRSYTLDQIPKGLERQVADADAAIKSLRDRLAGRLGEAMQSGGPVHAITACRDDAQTMTADVARGGKVDVGRTSHRLRNPANAPREWVKPFIARTGGKAQEFKPVVVDLGGGRIGLLRPIGINPICLNCHGPESSLKEPVAAVLRESYPEDQATGFAQGDLRGLFWAETR